MASASPDPRPPWNVAGLPWADTASETAGWRYVVLEEIVDSVATLRRWTWPLADERGHLVWLREEQLDSATIPVKVLVEQLYRPSGLERDPRIGDTFAVIAETAAERWPARVADLAPLLAGRVFDVSAEARLAARFAYQGSVAAVLPAAAVPAEPGRTPLTAPPAPFMAPELTVAPRGPGRG